MKVVDIGIQGGWAEFKDHPIQLPPLHLDRLKGLPDPLKPQDSSQSSSDRLRDLSAVVDQYEKLKASRMGNTGDNVKVSKLPEKEAHSDKK